MSTVKSPDEKLKEMVEEFYLKNKRSIRKKDFDIFHCSVQQKLWEANFYSDQIKNFNAESFTYSQTTDLTTGTATIIYGLDKDAISKYCNLFLDGYFTSVMSIFDSLAHEVNSLFRILPSNHDTKIYISTIIKKLKEKMPNSEFYKYISKIIKKRWWRILENFRNAITHEVIIAKEIEISYDATLGKEVLKKIPLPDNPKRRSFTYKKEYELKSFIETFHKDVWPILEHCYKRLIKDLEKSNKLPIKL